MKFGKNLLRVVELSDPEWGPYFVNYKFLKKKINDIVKEREGAKICEKLSKNPVELLSRSATEVDFFKTLQEELVKTSKFFETTERIYLIRHARINEGYVCLKTSNDSCEKNSWSRLLRACVNFYKDVLLLENFAIMNYCAFSKILKKHDKLTGFTTRGAYMSNVVSRQNFTHYPNLMELLRKVEQLFEDIQKMDNFVPLREEERLFIDAMRDLNRQATNMQEQENTVSDADVPSPSTSHSIPQANEEAAAGNSVGDRATTTEFDIAIVAASAAATRFNSDPMSNLQSVMSWMKAITSSSLGSDGTAMMGGDEGVSVVPPDCEELRVVPPDCDEVKVVPRDERSTVEAKEGEQEGEQVQGKRKPDDAEPLSGGCGSKHVRVF